MALTEFGRELRIARLKTDITLAAQAQHVGVTPTFMSGVETGRKKVPAGMAQALIDFFAGHGYVFSADMHALAAVANKSVSLEGLPLAQQMFLASFARASVDADSLKRYAELLSKSNREK